ncbi:MAG: acyl-CoA dehydrogenase family protein [Gammaproteobacteria bacterium]
MSDARELIAEGIERLLGAEVNRPLLEDFETGRWPAGLWAAIEDAGYAQVLAADGAARDWTDAAPVLRALGRHRAPVPLAETVVANWLLARAGLPVEPGPVTLLDADPSVQLRRAGTGVQVSGVAPRVPWARFARRAVYGAELDGRQVLALIDLPEDAIVEAGTNAAAEPRDGVRLDGCTVRACAPVQAGSASIRTYGALARAAEISGAIESVLAQALQYANDRVQFGRPIGKFQAIQHMLAELACESAAANAAVAAACEVAGSDDDRIEIATAKIRAGDAAGRATAIAHQVHGAIGFTYEHTLHFATRRLWSWRAEYGAGAQWAAWLGGGAVAAGAEGFWPAVTAR